jgi:AAA15 family ATPase/GTPase
MLQSLEIENFKGIQHLKLDEFKRVNLIAGKNNTCKTTVLTSICAAFPQSDISTLVKQLINHINLPVLINKQNLEDAFSIIFFNLNENMSAKLTAFYEFEAEKRTKFLTEVSCLFNKEYNAIQTGLKEDSLNLNFSEISPEKLGLVFKMVCQNPENDIAESTIYFATDNESEEKIKANFKPEQPVKGWVRVPSRGMMYNGSRNNQAVMFMVDAIDKLELEKRISYVVEPLKEIDTRIQSITLGKNNAIYIDIGLEKLILAQSLGDGSLKIMDILLLIEHLSGGILLVDEIENGLHWSSMVTLWRAIFAAAKLYNVQIFATTHSQECIRAAVIANTDVDGNRKKDDICLYRIERLEDESLKAIHYDTEGLQDAIDINWELR